MIERVQGGTAAMPGVRAVDDVAPATAGHARVGTPPVTIATARPGVSAGSPPIDAARVTVLRDAIATGQYHVDPRAIAARMIASDLG